MRMGVYPPGVTGKMIDLCLTGLPLVDMVEVKK